METQPAIIFRRGEEIDQREAGANILLRSWKAFAPESADAWNRRIVNSRGYIVAAYVGNVIAGVLEGMRLNLNGDPEKVPATFAELTAEGSWTSHRDDGDTVMLVDLTISPEYRGAGLFAAFVRFARQHFESPSGVILTYSPLFPGDKRYLVVNKHRRLGARFSREMYGSRPGLTMHVGGEDIVAEDVGITAYSI